MFATAALAVVSLLPAQPAPAFAFRDGDRIVWIGNTLVEREQRYGYWETALHAAHPDKTLTFRNLGWSGDTVHAEARGRFDFNNPDACLKQLVGLTLELKPTVILISYGSNEAFAGPAGLPRFVAGLEKLLDQLAPAKARVVLFTPLPFESGPATAHNADVKKYAEAIRAVAAKRNLFVADMAERLDKQRAASAAPFPPLTDNGIHLDENGYKFTADTFLASLGVRSSPDWKKLDALRAAVVAKNELFFHRWRPQNETYLFGFRKHEQGKNAKEIVEFDPLVAKAEDEIVKLRKELK